MNLNSKYLAGLSIILIISIGFLLIQVIFDVSPALRLITLGITTTIVGLVFIALLFSPERIKGYKAEYEFSPDLKKFEVKKTFSQVLERPPTPEVAYCSACGKKIFQPFYCPKCGQFLCGDHYLSGDHTCREDV